MPFNERTDVTGVASKRSRRAFKEFEAAIDRAVGERVRADGTYGFDLYSALTCIQWRSSNGAVVSYTFREAGELVAWVREEGGYIDWYSSGPEGKVAPWIAEAMASEDWWPDF